MASFKQWVAGARPRTLPAALAPVATGVGLSLVHVGYLPGITIPRAGLALVLALALQIGVNYANDYSDGIKGTDDNRLGPFRLTGSKAATPAKVKLAAIISFAIGALAGLILVALAGAWWMIAIGVLSILAAWFYTGGKKPYGYMGLGELMVFLFFGLVAVMGTSYLISGQSSLLDLAVASAIGLWACAVMLTNNLRDIPSDQAANKLTLAVRLGDQKTRYAYVVAMLLPFILLIPLMLKAPYTALVLLVLALCIKPIQIVLKPHYGQQLIAVLGQSAKVELFAGILILLGSWLSITF